MTTTTTRTWLTEFGEEYAIPAEILALVAAGKLQDQSWHNNTCPSFLVPNTSGSVILWIEHPDPNRREGHGKRFVVCLQDEDEGFLCTAIQTDRLPELLHYLADHWDVRPLRLTAGNWHMGQGNGEGFIFADAGRMRLETGGTSLYPIAKWDMGYDKAEDEANGRAMAALPQLLAVCRAVLGDGPTALDPDVHHALIAQARAAYAKATGQK